MDAQRESLFSCHLLHGRMTDITRNGGNDEEKKDHACLRNKAGSH